MAPPRSTYGSVTELREVVLFFFSPVNENMKGIMRYRRLEETMPGVFHGPRIFHIKYLKAVLFIRLFSMSYTVIHSSFNVPFPFLV